MLILSVFSTASATISISDVYPSDNSRHVEIINNPPDPGGYVNLSATLTDSTGGDDMEYYLDIWNGTAWKNRQHVVGASSPADLLQDDYFFNTTCSDYLWRIRTYDATDSTWNNQTFNFKSDCKPSPPSNLQPSNHSMYEAGSNVELFCDVYHPDNPQGAKIYNVTFHEYPSGRIIGYNQSTTQWWQNHKMHSPQEPNPNGYDINFSGKQIGDDWNCTESGNISNIYFWLSFAYDNYSSIPWFNVSIYDNVEAFVDEEYSHPGNELWNRNFSSSDFTISEAGNGTQGFQWNSYMGGSETDNHENYYRVDIENISSPYSQTEGNIYWLVIEAPEYNKTHCPGWKTTASSYQDVAVEEVAGTPPWQRVAVGEANFYDLAFVIAGDGPKTSIGWNNGTTVKCNSTFFLKDTGTRYYWYAKAKDDEYWGPPSGFNVLKTYYNDTEPDNTYYFQGGQMFVEEPYTDTEPNQAYYFQGGTITVRREATFSNPVPSNGSTGVTPKTPTLQIDVNASQPMNVDVTFQQNDSGTWQDISPTYSVTTNTSVSNRHYELQNNQKYYWRAKAYNSTTGITFYSDVFHFTTSSYTDTEPDNTYYFQGGQMFVEEPYTDTEPNQAYYYQGAKISISYQPHLTNFTPSNGTTTTNFSETLSAWLYKNGDPVHYDVSFYTNDTVDETWTQIESTLNQQKTNKTVSMVFSYDESYGETYYWKMRVVNESLNTDFNSSTFYFSTANYTDLEPNENYYFQGGQIFVEEPYTDTEPNQVYYYQGAEISVGLVKTPTDPYPADGSSFGTHVLEKFSAYVEDTDGDDMDVTFHYASNNTIWATLNNVSSGTRAETTNLPQLSNGSAFNWYVVADDGDNTAQSNTWTYTPQNQVPFVYADPAEGDSYIPVRREFIGGAFEKYIRLTANVVDEEGDTIKIQIYSDDPSQPNWDDWELRLSHESDSYEVYSSSPYIQDETSFDETDTSYHWRVYLEDPYGSKNYYMNFTSRFLFYSYFDWIPNTPTNEDSITLIDQSENASYLEWRLNGEAIASKNFSSGTHTPFNYTTNINISNVYNVSLWINNHTADCVGEMHSDKSGSPGYMYVDRNLSLNSTDGEAGINYVAYHLINDTYPAKFAEKFDVPDRWWLHRYDGSTWEGWFVNVTGENYTIYSWDSIAVVGNKNYSTRINISQNVNAEQTKILQKGLHYIVYSNITSTTLKNLTKIGVKNGDWVYLYNTTTGIWGYYHIGWDGLDWIVKPYDVIVLKLPQSRLINIGWI